MRLTPIASDVYPDHECSCGRPAHIAIVNMNPVGKTGYDYHDRICSSCALEFIRKLAAHIRPDVGMTKQQLKDRRKQL